MISNLLIFTSNSCSDEAFIMPEISSDSFYNISKFILSCFIIFIACEIFYYWDNINYLIYLLLVISFYLIDKLIIFAIKSFSNKIVLTIQFVYY